MARLSHIGLTVKDLDRSLAFYRDVAGMDPGAVLEGQDGPTGRSADSTVTRMRMVHLIAGTFVLQLIQYVSGGGDVLSIDQRNVGSPHISFYVPDVDAKYAEVKARGDVMITSAVNKIGFNLRSFYTRDPDGIPVEFVQTTS
jgi:glyoxylase I family protein